MYICFADCFLLKNYFFVLIVLLQYQFYFHQNRFFIIVRALQERMMNVVAIAFLWDSYETTTNP